MNNVNLYIGNNIILKHSDLFKLGNKALIVTGKSSAVKSGALDDVLNVLKKQNVEYIIYDEIKQNPSVSSCIQASKLGKDCDFVIGIGGGSPLDATKAIAIFIPNQDLTEEELYSKSWDNKPLDFMLVGTTAGTGSEVTKVAVLTDSNNKKHSLNDNCMYAKYAFGDPKYTLTLDKDFTISTGIDAICHATESFFSNKATDESREYSIKAIKSIFPILISKNNNLTIKEREILYRGSIDAGYAINITGTTFGHNVGYYLTEEYNLPHGIACAIFLSDVIDYQIKNNNDYANKFFKSINLTVSEFKDITTILPKTNITMSLKQIESILPRWMNNGSVKNTYGEMNIEDIKNILIKNFLE